MLLFLSGDADFFIQGTTYHMVPNSLLTIHPGESHHLTLKSNAPYERILIRFPAAIVDPIFQQFLPNIKPFLILDQPALLEEFQLLFQCFDASPFSTWESLIVWKLNCIFSYLCQDQNISQSTEDSRHQIDRLLASINENLDHIHTIDDIMEFSHLARSTTHKLFKKYMSTTVMDYVRTQKCIRAQFLMENGVSATECAIRLGFSDYSSFYRAYKKVFGYPPSQTNPKK